MAMGLGGGIDGKGLDMMWRYEILVKEKYDYKMTRWQERVVWMAR